MLRTGVSLIALTAGLAFPALAHAQAANADQGAVLEEVVVTALKTSTSVQDTPATVAVVGRETLQQSAVNSIQQIGSIVPGVIIQRPPNNSANASIRGIGTSPGPVSFDQGVAMFIDGVYAARGADFLSSLFDIERVEVVKGTQAAVLGKNTSLGALTLTTRRPDHEFGGNVLASYEFERGSKVFSGGVDFPIGDTWAIRVAAQRQDLGGITTNAAAYLPYTEDEGQTTTDSAFRVTSDWIPSDDLRLTTNYLHSESTNVGLPAELIVGSPAALAVYTAAGFANLYETRFDLRNARFSATGPSRLEQNTDRATNTLEYDLGNMIVTAITGYSQFKQNRRNDLDGSPGTYFLDGAKIIGRQFSQELRVASDIEGSFSYLAGALYLDNFLRQNVTQAQYYPTSTGQYTARFKQDTKTWSAYAQVNYEFTEQLSVTGGVRATTEDKDAEMERIRVVPGAFSTTQNPPYPLTYLSRSETVVDGSVSIKYQPIEEVMLYASAGQGTKGGGFTDVGLPVNAEYRKEVARTVEAGVKVQGASRTWHFNAAVFNTDVTDFQNNFYNGFTFIVQNLDIRSRGLEFDGRWQITPELRFFAEGTFADAVNKSALPGVGDRMPRAPRFAGKAGFNYERDLTERFRLRLASDYTYRSKISHQTNPNAVPFGEEYGTFNATIGISDPEIGWDLSLIGRNLNDARSLSFAYPSAGMPGSVTGHPEESRTVTLQLRYEF
jgi:iron complex outermembrane recepter protein